MGQGWVGPSGFETGIRTPMAAIFFFFFSFLFFFFRSESPAPSP